MILNECFLSLFIFPVLDGDGTIVHPYSFPSCRLQASIPVVFIFFFSFGKYRKYLEIFVAINFVKRFSDTFLKLFDCIILKKKCLRDSKYCKRL